MDLDTVSLDYHLEVRNRPDPALPIIVHRLVYNENLLRLTILCKGLDTIDITLEMPKILSSQVQFKLFLAGIWTMSGKNICHPIDNTLLKTSAIWGHAVNEIRSERFPSIRYDRFSLPTGSVVSVFIWTILLTAEILQVPPHLLGSHFYMEHDRLSFICNRKFNSLSEEYHKFNY